MELENENVLAIKQFIGGMPMNCLIANTFSTVSIIYK